MGERLSTDGRELFYAFSPISAIPTGLIIIPDTDNDRLDHIRSCVGVINSEALTHTGLLPFSFRRITKKKRELVQHESPLQVQ